MMPTTKSKKCWKNLILNGYKEALIYIRKADLTDLYKVITALSKIDWFKKSVRDIRVFKVEYWSDFTEIVKNS